MFHLSLTAGWEASWMTSILFSLGYSFSIGGKWRAHNDLTVWWSNQRSFSIHSQYWIEHYLPTYASMNHLIIPNLSKSRRVSFLSGFAKKRPSTGLLACSTRLPKLRDWLYEGFGDFPMCLDSAMYCFVAPQKLIASFRSKVLNYFWRILKLLCVWVSRMQLCMPSKRRMRRFSSRLW